MKKTLRCVCLFLLIASLMFAVTGCGNERTGRCENCGQRERLYRYEYKNSDKTEWYCQTCYNLAKLFGF